MRFLSTVWYSGYGRLLFAALMIGLALAVDANAAGGLLLAMPVVPVVDAGAWANKMIQRASAAAADWERGVQNPSASPTGRMKAAKGRYKAEMLASINEGRWDKAIDGLTDEMIAAAAMARGGAAFTGGIQARQAKIREAIARLQPLVVQHKQTIDAMPVDSEQAREAKMLANLRGMRKIGKQLNGLAG